MNPNFIPCGTVKSELIARRLPEEGENLLIVLLEQTQYKYLLVLQAPVECGLWKYVCSTSVEQQMLTQVFLSGMKSAVHHRPRIHLSILVLLYLRLGIGQLRAPVDLISEFNILNSISFFI